MSHVICKSIFVTSLFAPGKNSIDPPIADGTRGLMLMVTTCNSNPFGFTIVSIMNTRICSSQTETEIRFPSCGLYTMHPRIILYVNRFSGL